MVKCAYCKMRATTRDALGLDACIAHSGEADEYYRGRYGRDPHEDSYLYCDVHCDMWQSGCERCEQCCHYHYGTAVQEFLASPLSKQLRVFSFDDRKAFVAFLEELMDQGGD